MAQTILGKEVQIIEETSYQYESSSSSAGYFKLDAQTIAAIDVCRIFKSQYGNWCLIMVINTTVKDPKTGKLKPAKGKIYCSVSRYNEDVARGQVKPKSLIFETRVHHTYLQTDKDGNVVYDKNGDALPLEFCILQEWEAIPEKSKEIISVQGISANVAELRAKIIAAKKASSADSKRKESTPKTKQLPF